MRGSVGQIPVLVAVIVLGRPVLNIDLPTPFSGDFIYGTHFHLHKISPSQARRENLSAAVNILN